MRFIISSPKLNDDDDNSPDFFDGESLYHIEMLPCKKADASGGSTAR